MPTGQAAMRDGEKSARKHTPAVCDSAGST
jgi:hypothetical protein